MNATLIVDNSKNSYHLNPENAIPISSWVGCQKDTELLKLRTFLNEMAT